MDAELIRSGKWTLISPRTDDVLVREPSDAIALLELCGEYDVQRIILVEKNFSPDFFELRSGLAGEILQKFSQYGLYLGIVGDFSSVESKSLRDFIRESNRYGRILFVSSPEEALEQWDKQ